MSKPVVTIGICVKNNSRTLAKAIESIILQDFPNELMEVIFVDDGSTDDSLSIINRYLKRLDMRVKVFHHEWRGLGFSRNFVVDKAEGTYIIWVDGDMILPADHVRKQVAFMEKNPNVGIAKAKYGILNNEKPLAFLDNVSYVAVDFIFGGRLTDRPLGTGGSIYRMKAIRMVGGFNINISGVGEDMDIEYRVRKAGWLLFLGTPAVFYEQRRTSLAHMWQEASWHGRGGHDILRKEGEIFAFYKNTPVAGFFAGLWYATVAYNITRRKLVFLLPLQYAFKRIAWCWGFLKGQIAK